MGRLPLLPFPLFPAAPTRGPIPLAQLVARNRRSIACMKPIAALVIFLAFASTAAAQRNIGRLIVERDNRSLRNAVVILRLDGRQIATLTSRSPTFDRDLWTGRRTLTARNASMPSSRAFSTTLSVRRNQTLFFTVKRRSWRSPDLVLVREHPSTPSRPAPLHQEAY